MLAPQLALVELEVVEVGVVGLDRLEQQVARLLEVGVDGELERVEGRVDGRLDRIREEVVEGERGLLGVADGARGDLVEEGGEEVRVVDDYGVLDEDLLEGELGLLEAVVFGDISVRLVEGKVSHLPKEGGGGKGLG